MKTLTIRRPAPLLFASWLFALAGPAGALVNEDILWLSDSGPKREKTAPAPAASPAQGNDSVDAAIAGGEGDNLHSGVKRVWVRQGDDLAKAAYVPATAMVPAISLLDAKGKRSQAPLTPIGGLAHAKCEFEELGFNNAYLTQKTVQDGVLRVQVAKAELLKGHCCVKSSELDPVHEKAIADPEQPLEIIRQHKPDEKLFTRLFSGDTVDFTVQRLGAPLAGAKVTMLTQQGWQKTALTDAGGKVQFTLIRDYFPHWSDFKRLTKENFVIVANAEAAENGAFAGQPYQKVRYQATLSGKYAPSPYDYKSYAWGLGISLFVFVFGGLAVYLYRRRRTKPFREVRFSESASESP